MRTSAAPAKRGVGPRWAGAALGSALLAVSVGAVASPPVVRLVYEGLDGCSSEAELREAVATRLGYDPFDPDAPQRVRASVRRAGPALLARLELRDGAGKLNGSRDLRAASGDCAELTSTMAIALSLAIDPLSLGRPSAPAGSAAPDSSAAPAASSAPLAASLAPAPGPPPAAPAPSLALRLGLGVLATAGAGPGPTVGPTVQVGLRRGSASIALEGRADLATSTRNQRGGVESSLLLATVAPCGHVGAVLGCLLGSLGVLRGTGRDVGLAQSQVTSYAAVGARLGAELPLSSTLWLRVHADAMAPLKPIALAVDGLAVWTTPSFWAGLGAGLGMTFLGTDRGRPRPSPVR